MSHWSIISIMMFIHQIVLKILRQITRPWNKGCWPVFILRSKFGSPCLIIRKYDTHPSNNVWDLRQNHWTMKYRSQWHTFILRANFWPYWPIIPKYDVHKLNSLQDITQNQWIKKYRSRWPTFILSSTSGIIPNNDVHTSKNRRYKAKSLDHEM